MIGPGFATKVGERAIVRIAAVVFIAICLGVLVGVLVN